MSSILQGDGTKPAPTGTAIPFLGVAGTTWSSGLPIAVQTSGPHGWYSGDTVELEGLQDPGANSTFVITVTDSTHFTLNGSAAAGTLATGGAFGYAFDYGVQPAFQVAAPGELASMQTLTPVLQGIFNAIPFLYRLLGRRRTHLCYYGPPPLGRSTYAGYFSSSWAQVSPTTGGSAYGHFPIIGTMASLLSLAPTDGPSASPIVGVDDELDVAYVTTATLASTDSSGAVVLSVGFGGIPIANVTNAGGLFEVTTALPMPTGFATNGQVILIGIGGATSANGSWKATVIDSTHFTLQGSSFSGSYTSGGTVWIPGNIIGAAQVIPSYAASAPLLAAPVPVSLRATVTGTAINALANALGLANVIPGPVAIGLQYVNGGSDASPTLALYGPAQITVIQRRRN